jgi:hypothetical protein
MVLKALSNWWSIVELGIYWLSCDAMNWAREAHAARAFSQETPPGKQNQFDTCVLAALTKWPGWK